MNEQLSNIVSHFQTQGTVNDIRPLGSGLINDTYKVTTAEPDEPDYVLQRINHAIFQDVDGLQHNIEAVTAHIRRKLEERGEKDVERKVLHFLPADNGKTYWYDGASYWRMMVFIPRAKTYETVNPEYSYCAGKAFGEFEAMLADVTEPLVETIPDFHNTPKRLRDLEAAARADGCGRAAGVQEELGFFMERSGRVGLALSMQQRGEIPLRVTHNDTKLNNVLLDRKTVRALCVVDLDTVMPGLSLYDFGDAIRTGASTALEDERDLERVSLSLPFYTAFTKGFLEECAASLTEAEIRMLPYGAWLMTMECGIRFLTDYLSGDTYFHISRREHNLDRCRTQIRLAADMERQMEQMEAIAAETAGRVREKNPG